MRRYEVSPKTLQSLATKIRSLKLSPEEKGLLDEIVARAGSYGSGKASEPLVVRSDYSGLVSGADLDGGLSLRLGVAGGQLMRPEGWPPPP